MDKDSKSRAAYEYKRIHWWVSWREAAKEHGISHVALLRYRDKIEGNYSPKIRKLSQSSRLDMKLMHGKRCYIYWKTFPPDELEIDHWDGDSTDDSYGNLVPLCQQCHRYKTGHKTIAFTYRFGSVRNTAIIEENEDE
jgi:HNH endonuclease